MPGPCCLPFLSWAEAHQLQLVSFFPAFYPIVPEALRQLESTWNSTMDLSRAFLKRASSLAILKFQPPAQSQRDLLKPGNVRWGGGWSDPRNPLRGRISCSAAAEQMCLWRTFHTWTCATPYHRLGETDIKYFEIIITFYVYYAFFEEKNVFLMKTGCSQV